MTGRGTTDSPTERLDRLRARGVLDLTEAGVAPARTGPILDDLLARYGEPHRRYHTVEHLDEALDRADHLANRAGDPTVVCLALWFHDAVYRLRPGQDEADSADLAETVLADGGVDAERRTDVARLVRLTAGHGPVGPDDRDGAVVIDADLGILAAEPARYDRYVADVRAEHGAVDDEAWRVGRARVLRGLLDRPRLFLTDGLGPDADPRARANLARELAGLRG